jgi:hypothetical protein
MSKIWRWIAPAAATGTIVAGAMVASAVVITTGIPAQAASQAAPHLTIGARGTAAGSVKGKVLGHALVAYQAAGHDKGTISGTVTGNQAGDVVLLLARPFKAATYTPTGQQVTLAAAGTGTYSFSVLPSLATSYEVRLTTQGATDATSGPAAVYVETSGHGFKAHQKCSATKCTFWYTGSQILPASAYNTESHKHVYMYLAQWYSAKHPAKWYNLTKSAKTSKPKRISGHEFELTFTWYIHTRAGQNYWLPLSCTKDSEAKDGLGLPGHHGCGAKRVSVKAAGYLG